MLKLYGPRAVWEKAGSVPVLKVSPGVPADNRPVVFYHGWSTDSEKQLSKALLMAAYGYTVFIPELINHGQRGALPDYYCVQDYDQFWHTVLATTEEYEELSSFIAADMGCYPVVMGHSMGGFIALGIGSRYADRLNGIISMNGSGDWMESHHFFEQRFHMNLASHWTLCNQVEENTPLAHTGEMKDIPCLLLSGEADASVAMQAQQHFYNVLHQTNTRAEYRTYPGLGHFVTINMMDDALQWLNRISMR
ncbi:S9 family peptidase [uncultured Allisonella sp.]|uniref:alpha/beta hydrolase family protein n=1 Tax=Allisonella histaminiformans TaxID=209880 RepID=UPI002588BFCB|nr:alpha/beta fold hydrolase [uncultured Allisonella sp.]